MAVAQPLVELRGAAFRYGGREVFSGLDLDMNRGEVLSLLGPNGCGKSTLLRCIGGSLPLAAGTVRVAGVDLARLDAAARARRIGFLFQQHTPSFPFPVLDVVGMGRAPHLGLFASPSSRDMALAERALERVDLLQVRDRPYTELSGGERQLVLLARTLAQEPDLLLLDEPTSHLDFRNQALSLKTIGALAREGMTMIMATHDPNHAFLFPGKVALMKQGRIVAVGPAEDVVTEAALSDIYGVDVALYRVPRRSGTGELRLCSPWLP